MEQRRRSCHRIDDVAKDITRPTTDKPKHHNGGRNSSRDGGAGIASVEKQGGA